MNAAIYAELLISLPREGGAGIRWHDPSPLIHALCVRHAIRWRHSVMF